MAIPSRAQLHAEVDQQFRALHPDAPRALDPNDPSQAELVAAWLKLRDTVVNEWTDAVFFEYFPALGRLDPDNPEHGQFIKYWTDIRDQIRDDAPPRFVWDTGPAEQPGAPTRAAGPGPQPDRESTATLAEPDRSEVEERVRLVLEGAHILEGLAEAVTIIAGAEVIWLEALGGTATVVIAGWEVLDAFETGARIANAQGLCYGLMFEALDMPDAELVRPDFPIVDDWDYLLQAWYAGLAEGRSRAKDPANRNRLLLLIALESEQTGDQAPWAVLNQLWQAVRPKLPAGDYTAEWLDWPTPRPYGVQ